ncbi:MAG: hypothetical protein NTAFB09_20050 [Nitrosospira sp.]
MQVPKGIAGGYNAFARWVFKIYKIPFVEFFCAPILLTIPPVLLTRYTDSEKFHDFVSKLVPSLANFLDEYYLLTVVIGALYTFSVLAFAKSVARRVNLRGMDVDGLLSLIGALDAIVGLKGRRFGDHVKNMDTLNKESLFCDITQPREQLADIVRAIWQLFDNAKTRESRNLIRVVCVEMTAGKITDIPLYFPLDEIVKASVEDLNNPSSALMTAFKTKKILIISDIAAELKKPETKRRYAAVGNSKDDSGSIICYPISHNPTRQIPFVVSIHCDEPNYFKPEFAEIYRLNLERFELRMSLEYSLMVIKERICE